MPLEKAPEVILVNVGETSKPGCPGQVEEIPAADPGKLCVYENFFQGASANGFVYGDSEGFYGEGATNTGTLFKINCAQICIAGGNWAVTAE
jgi:hypothetical protein